MVIPELNTQLVGIYCLYILIHLTFIDREYKYKIVRNPVLIK